MAELIANIFTGRFGANLFGRDADIPTLIEQYKSDTKHSKKNHSDDNRVGNEE